MRKGAIWFEAENCESMGHMVSRHLALQDNIPCFLKLIKRKSKFATISPISNVRKGIPHWINLDNQ